jgi:hypothetical protein
MPVEKTIIMLLQKNITGNTKLIIGNPHHSFSVENLKGYNVAYLLYTQPR